MLFLEYAARDAPCRNAYSGVPVGISPPRLL